MRGVRGRLVAVAGLSLGLTAVVLCLGVLGASLLEHVPSASGAGATSAGGVLTLSTPVYGPLQVSRTFAAAQPTLIARPVVTSTVPSSDTSRGRPQWTHRPDAHEARRPPLREPRHRSRQSLRSAATSDPAAVASAAPALLATPPASKRRTATHPMRPARAQKALPRSLRRQDLATVHESNGHARAPGHSPPAVARGHRPKPAHPAVQHPEPVAGTSLPAPPNVQPGRGPQPEAVGHPAQQPKGHAMSAAHGHGHDRNATLT